MELGTLALKSRSAGGGRNWAITDEDAAAAELLTDYEARIAALERLVGRQALEIELSQRGSTLQTLAEKRAYIRDRRPAGLSVQRGCELMRVGRSSFYAEPAGKRDNGAIVAEIRIITDEFEGYGYRRVDAELPRDHQRHFRASVTFLRGSSITVHTRHAWRPAGSIRPTFCWCSLCGSAARSVLRPGSWVRASMPFASCSGS